MPQFLILPVEKPDTFESMSPQQMQRIVDKHVIVAKTGPDDDPNLDPGGLVTHAAQPDGADPVCATAELLHRPALRAAVPVQRHSRPDNESGARDRTPVPHRPACCATWREEPTRQDQRCQPSQPHPEGPGADRKAPRPKPRSLSNPARLDLVETSVGARTLLVLLSLVASPAGALLSEVRGQSNEPADRIPGVPASAVVAFVGVDVIPMDSELVLHDQTVVVESGRIARIGPTEEVDLPSNAVVINGEGKCLVPGLFDVHVHLAEPYAEHHLFLYLAHGITTIQSMHGSPWHLELARRVRAGDLLGPRILTTGPTTAMVGISTPEEARALVREQSAAGYDAIKQYGAGEKQPRETYSALMHAAREADMRVVGHAPRNLPFSVVLEERQNSIDHMEEIVYTHRPITELFGPWLDIQFGRKEVDDWRTALDSLPDLDLEALGPAIRDLASQLAEAGTAVTPTLVAFEGIARQVSDEYESQLSWPELAYIHPLLRADWGPALNRYRAGGWADKLPLMHRILSVSLELQRRMVGAIHGAGVPVLAGTDAPLPFVLPGWSLHRELALLSGSGLSSYAALRAATALPAEELGIEVETGTIEEGKSADLVLVDRNPLNDVGNLIRISGVMTRGRWLSRSDLDTGFAAIAEAYRPLKSQMSPVLAALDAGEAATVLDRYTALRRENPEIAGEMASMVERVVNRLGYRHLGAGDVDRAIAVFRLNTEAFPEAFNTWDSLAEAYMVRGENELAIRYYEKSLELNHENENAKRMIERIRAGAEP